ncbi:unnamed protein product [Paramecium primaurelia]|uniref:Uncharacterized protein n=1 Tax=Paramecium primaurelia TaxID=5886 RepID=A0A8S1K705_PARPR|nr:unnamed protein product [Paramecium primaurelia]
MDVAENLCDKIAILVKGQIHIPSQSFNFYNTYVSLTELVQRKLIHDFSIYQSSLQSVFLQFSKSQHDQYN